MGLTDTDRRMLPIAYEEAKAGFDEGGCPIGSVLAALSADFALLYSKTGRPSIAPDRIYEDLASGRRDDRPGLEACLKALQPGNTLVVWKLDRLGRDLKHLVAVVDELRSRGVGFRALIGAEIDTTTANGRLVFGIFASLAEFERELIAERTRAGLAAARARDRSGGHPRKMEQAMLRIAMSAMADRETDVETLHFTYPFQSPYLG